ncbi:MAG: hypothetical protein ACJA2X_001411 [Halocynthiibacter sp.]|jgi:hypothetical protein
MKLPTGLRDSMREIVVDRNDRSIAQIFREKNASDVVHLSDEQLFEQVREGRKAALSFGIKRPKLRMRFIMLHVLRVPHFWTDEDILAMLNGATGTPDIRFGDVCALFRSAAQRQGQIEKVWWT